VERRQVFRNGFVAADCLSQGHSFMLPIPAAP
jgi:hypothetical protein